MAEKDGGPAFPAKRIRYDGSCQTTVLFSQGMTLRDYFAGQGLSGWISDPCIGDDTNVEHIAKKCYELADAMLAEREENNERRL